MQTWWQMDLFTAAQVLETDPEKGLSLQAAAQRLQENGPNQLREERRSSSFVLFINQFKGFIIWVLIAAALISGFLQEWIDALAIIAIVIINAILGYIQENRAEKSLAALKELSSPSSRVIRDGQSLMVDSRNLTKGDLVEIEAGDYIPADGRLVYATGNFLTQEASLTGESAPVNKQIGVIESEHTQLADRSNMLFLGTSVVSGKARMLITHTGMETELGKIAGMIQEIKEDSTPLQKKLEEFGKIIVYISFILVGMVFLAGYLRGEEVLNLFLTAVSLAVAAIPEGLPAVVTISLALGVQRLVKRHCLIRKLPSVETLGCTTVICSDKTGTLTRNEMTVQYLYQSGEYFALTGIGYEPAGDFLLHDEKIIPTDYEGLIRLLTGSALCNGAQLVQQETGYRIVGDPTEGALLTAAAKAGLLKSTLEESYPFCAEIPFDPERKQMTIIRKRDDHHVAFVKGAPDVLLNHCTAAEEDGEIVTLDDNMRAKIIKANTSLAENAMRVLAFAYRRFQELPDTSKVLSVESELVFLGLIAMIDPPRPEVKLAMSQCRTAGIRSVMITGDHKNTAVAIARELDLYQAGSLAFSGEEIDRQTDEELLENLENTVVYARVSPEHKLRIVKAWQQKGEIVAMTGDGVNDAPALKEADIGVAMGVTGTDVTREVSDMVITDDNFASIVAAVEEGRGIFDNIRKFIHYLLSCNVGEILVMFVASVIGWPIPLLPVQILWVNLVTDGLPALALGVDPSDPRLMYSLPRKKTEKLITRTMGGIMLIQGSFIAFCSLLAFWYVLFAEHEGIEHARTAGFIVLSCSQLFHSFNCRSRVESIFRLGFFSNMRLIQANLVSFALQMAVVYIPFFQIIFKTSPLGLFDWVLVLVISSFPLLAMEIAKLVYSFVARR